MYVQRQNPIHRAEDVKVVFQSIIYELLNIQNVWKGPASKQRADWTAENHESDSKVVHLSPTRINIHALGCVVALKTLWFDPLIKVAWPSVLFER